MMDSCNLPDYSERTVALARAYDRAALACKATGWHLSDLRDDNPEIYGSDDDLAAYAEKRIDLLRESLNGIRDAVNEAIRRESAPVFEVQVDVHGQLVLPHAVNAALAPYMDVPMMIPHEEHRDTNLASTIGMLKHDWHLILFDDELFKLPKHYPLGFVEVWWRRWFYNLVHSRGRLYELCLVPNPEYGWDCFGHER